MRLPAGGLLALAIATIGCNSSNTPTIPALPAAATNNIVGTASQKIVTVSEQQASAARAQNQAQGNRRQIVVISGPVGAEWDHEYTADSPPAPRIETPSKKIRPNAAWVPGRWEWFSYRWLYVSGFWK